MHRWVQRAACRRRRRDWWYSNAEFKGALHQRRSWSRFSWT